MKKWLLGIVAIATLFCAVEVKAQNEQFHPGKEYVTMYALDYIVNDALGKYDVTYEKLPLVEKVGFNEYNVSGIFDMYDKNDNLDMKVIMRVNFKWEKEYVRKKLIELKLLSAKHRDADNNGTDKKSE